MGFYIVARSDLTLVLDKKSERSISIRRIYDLIITGCDNLLQSYLLTQNNLAESFKSLFPQSAGNIAKQSWIIDG